MYDSKRIKNKKLITAEYILDRVSEYDIYARYFGQFKIGAIYNSPLRKDKIPSFGIFWGKRVGKLLFKDHGTGEHGDVFKFVELYTGITDRNDLYLRIIEDLKIKNNTKPTCSKEYQRINSKTVIGVVRQDWTEIDIKYWSQFNISINTLKKFNVNSIKYYLCNGIVKGIYKDENPMYAYKVYDHFKIYRPLASKYTKWRNNLEEYDIQGYEQLPDKGDLLIITKSLKDVMVLYEMGFTAISPASETTFIPNSLLEALRSRFKRILICFDRDVPGIKNMRSISLKTGLNGFLVHKKFKSKDISDAVKNNGFDVIKKWLEKTLKKAKK